MQDLVFRFCVVMQNVSNGSSPLKVWKIGNKLNECDDV